MFRTGGVNTKKSRSRAHMPDAPASLPSRWCSLCGGEIYAGDNYYELDGHAVCPDCLPAFARGYFLGDLRVAMPPRLLP